MSLLLALCLASPFLGRRKANTLTKQAIPTYLYKYARRRLSGSSVNGRFSILEILYYFVVKVPAFSVRQRAPLWYLALYFVPVIQMPDQRIGKVCAIVRLNFIHGVGSFVFPLGAAPVHRLFPLAASISPIRRRTSASTASWYEAQAINGLSDAEAET